MIVHHLTGVVLYPIQSWVWSWLPKVGDCTSDDLYRYTFTADLNFCLTSCKIINDSFDALQSCRIFVV